jgi:hypothetical protein
MFKLLGGVRTALLSLLMTAAIVGVACSGGGDEDPTSAPTNAPAATVAPTAAPTPVSDDEVETGRLQVRVTDAPGDATAVLVTVSSVQDAADDAESWITVVEGPKTFDLVALDGVEAVLGESELANGKYGQIRLEVDEVEVVTPDDTFTATVPSGSLKLVGGFEIEPGVITGATIDFDLDKSLVEQGNGGFLFKPVVKLITSAPGESLDAPVPLLGDDDTDGQEPGDQAPDELPTAVPEPTETAIPAVTATPVPPTATATPTQSPVGEFFLAVETPETLEAVTSEAEFEVVGRASIDALVTVNDTIAELDVDGRFRVTVSLELGVNVVEVVASVASGDEFSEVIVLIRE